MYNILCCYTEKLWFCLILSTTRLPIRRALVSEGKGRSESIAQNVMTSSPYSMFGVGEIMNGLSGSNGLHRYLYFERVVL